MNSLQIIINNKFFQLGQLLPDVVNSLEIKIIPILLPVSSTQLPAIKAWLNQLVDNLSTEHVLVNNVLIPVSDIKKFKL